MRPTIVNDRDSSTRAINIGRRKKEKRTIINRFLVLGST